MAHFQNAHSLSSGDALFLYFERDGQPVNVASVNVYEGIIPLELCTGFIASKLHLIPRYLQRVVAPPYDIDLPTWEYDPDFDIRNHVREVRLKRGTEAEFKAVAARILSATMDRKRPLWDFTLVHGLAGNRTGAIVRLHHCLADGISGVRLLNVIMDPSPTPPAEQKAHLPRPPRQAGRSLLDGLVNSSISAVQRILTAETELLDLAKHVVASVTPREGENEAVQHSSNGHAPIPTLQDLKNFLPELAAAADRLPFNLVCRGPQKFNWAEIPLAEIKAVKQACGATVNDVVLTVVTSTVRRYAELHGVRLKGRRLRIIVPVNVRGDGDGSELGNRITFLPVNVPLDTRSSRELIEAVREAVARGKSARLGELVALLGTLIGTIPTALQALIGPVASQLPLSLCNLICTNVPGPQVPLYLLGHKMLACYPYVPIGGEMGMNCAVLTYNGTAYFGFTGDAAAIPDLQHMNKFLKQSFAELRKAAGGRSSRPPRARAKVAPAASSAPPGGERAVAPEAIAFPAAPAPAPGASEQREEKVDFRAAG